MKRGLTLCGKAKYVKGKEKTGGLLWPPGLGMWWVIWF